MKTTAFTLLEIMIVVAVIGLLASIAVPAFIRSRNASQQNACINNLRQIDSGKAQWAMAASRVDGDTGVTASINEYIRGGTTPRCPANGSYTYGVIGTDPDCNADTATAHDFAG